MNTWLSETPFQSSTTELRQQRAVLAWRRINRKPTPVAFKTSAGTLAAQVVRIESDSRASVAQSVAGVAPKRKVVIFGIRDHPTLPDTDVKEGYTFSLDKDRYTIIDVVITLGEVQAIAEATR